MVVEQLLYRDLTKIAEDYFGPAAPRFINRIIESHLHKSPAEITREDLPEVMTWVRLTVSMITDEQTVITEFTMRLQQLA